MRKLVLVLLAATICTLPSCITVGINDATKAKADEAIAQIKRLNDSLEAYQKDLQQLLEFLRKVFGTKVPAPTSETSPEKPK
jgi:peptidoglycan hydrolase CwlO-like protein